MEDNNQATKLLSPDQKIEKTLRLKGRHPECKQGVYVKGENYLRGLYVHHECSNAYCSHEYWCLEGQEHVPNPHEHRRNSDDHIEYVFDKEVSTSPGSCDYVERTKVIGCDNCIKLWG